ncbi:MAG: type IX secretion system outer membrane channel protein PorV [Bacteroidota bacterium]|nr:type IX secretion system outer membrane channel protein PorV [Bacteroidota bacterium]
MSKKLTILFTSALFSNALILSGQGNGLSRNQLAGQQNVITTAVPFLTITPDSRRAGMGDGGVASSPDANSVFWNAASLAFSEKSGGISTSYAPWLRSLVPGISYNYIAGYGKLTKRSVLGGGFRFFSFGDINFTDDVGNPLGVFNPSEYAVDVCYAAQLSKNWAIGTTLKFINSNLAGTRPLNGITPKVGRSGAGDISAMYKNTLTKKISGVEKKFDYSFGINLQNLGAKITYSDRTNREYLPAMLRIGTAWSYDIDEFNSFTAMLDFSKLMVPTPGIEIIKNYQGSDSTDIDNNVLYEKTKSEDPVITAALKSFSDAPGGFREELKEWNYSLGLEYIYAKQFMVRAGYFNEPATKGNRKYLTFGFGLKYKVFGLDAAYIVPFQQAHPLQNQLRFTLLFDLNAFSEKD